MGEERLYRRWARVFESIFDSPMVGGWCWMLLLLVNLPLGVILPSPVGPGIIV